MDIVKYAEKNECGIAINPVINDGKIKQWYVCVSADKRDAVDFTDQITEQFLDSLLAKIGRKKAFEFGAAHMAQRLRDRETFFRGL